MTERKKQNSLTKAEKGNMDQINTSINAKYVNVALKQKQT